jgi:hypothetical protein
MAGGVRKSAPLKWTTARENAAGLVADDHLSDDEIAAEVGVSPRTLAYWKEHPDFNTKVADLIEAARLAARALTIANKEVRVRRLAERAAKIDEVFAARAEEHATVPAGMTGLLVREPRIVKVYDVKNWRADDAEEGEVLVPTGGVRVAYAYKVDTATLAELRATEKQAAQELGEWVEKVSPTNAEGGDLTLADLLGLARGGAS